MPEALTRRRLLMAASGALLAAPATAAAAPVVAAASDLRFALPEIADAFAAGGGSPLRLVFGSSGNFYRQILQGAPYALYLSADEDYVLRLAERGHAPDAGALYAIGRIVLFAPTGSPLEVDPALDGLERALGAGRITRFAIANPEHAPYGRRAEEALRYRGLWQPLRPRLVLGESVAQAAQFAVSGSTQGGIFAHALAEGPGMGERGRYALIPAEWHAPLRQRMVLLRPEDALARRFFAFLQGPEAGAVLRRYGFELPGGSG